MWWEAVPGLAAMATCLGLGVWVLPKFVLETFNPGHQPFVKNVTHAPTIQHFLRDERLSGNAYIAQGLETVADEEPTITSAKSKCE